jgi:hypothetical protein
LSPHRQSGIHLTMGLVETIYSTVQLTAGPQRHISGSYGHGKRKTMTGQKGYHTAARYKLAFGGINGFFDCYVRWLPLCPVGSAAG